MAPDQSAKSSITCAAQIDRTRHIEFIFNFGPINLPEVGMVEDVVAAIVA